MKYKKYPKYKDSGVEWIGDIPEEWQIIGVTKCCNVISGTGFPIQYQGNTNNEFPFYKVSDTNLENNAVYMNNCNNTIKKEEIKILKAKIAPKNSIVFPKIGAVLLKNKRRILTKPSIFDNNMMALVPKRHHEKFLYYFLLVEDFLRIVNPGPVPSLGDSNISLVKVPLLPKVEETQIVEFLDKQTTQFDELINKSKVQITLLEEKRQATINQAVTKGLDLSVPMKDSGVEWIGEIPEGWEVRKVKHSSYVKGRIGYHGLRSDEFIDEGPYLITGTDFKDGKINWNTCYHVPEWRYEQNPFIQIKNNDVLITKDGTIGKIAFIENIPGKTTLNSHLLVVRPLKNSYEPRYLYWILLADCFTYYVNLVQSGSIMNSLSQQNLENFVFPLPPIVEENQIATYLDKQTTQFDELIAKSKTQIILLEEKRQALITAAVTGKIDVRSEVVA